MGIRISIILREHIHLITIRLEKKFQLQAIRIRETLMLEVPGMQIPTRSLRLSFQ